MTFDRTYTEGLAAFRKTLKTYEEPNFNFLTKFMFGGSDGIMTSDDYIQTKYNKIKNKLIADTRRGDSATVVNRDFKYTRKSYNLPYFFYQDGIGRDDRKILLPGEEPDRRFSQSQRMMIKMNNKVNSIRRDLDLIPEKYAADIILTGKVSPKANEGGDITFLEVGDTDFPLANNIFSEITAWDDAGISIYERISVLLMKQFKRTGIMPDTLIAPLSVTDLIMKDETILKWLDNKGVNIGNIAPLAINAQGYTEFGTIMFKGAALRIISYVGFYNDLEGVQQTFLPEDKIILTNRNIGSMNYGGLESVDSQGYPITVAGKELITVHRNDDIPASVNVKVQRSPLPMPEQLDGWATVKVLDI